MHRITHAIDKALDDFELAGVPCSQIYHHVIDLSVIRVGSLNHDPPHVLHFAALSGEQVGQSVT